MPPMLPVKKSVSFHWSGRDLSLDVAQDLFSSHRVDRGSKMLLSSLERIDWPDQGAAVDFGCGYGVLGLAWQSAHPPWAMHYVDRDALAVAFARHNVTQAGGDLMERARFFHATSPPRPPDRGFDLVLWNVPGKAGRDVVQSLARIVLDGLAPNGVLALVVVHPLADALRDVAARSDVMCDYDDAGRDHTVLHLRQVKGNTSWRDAFDSGEFDRPDERFSLGVASWRLTPVVGLPEYDSLDYATELAGELMIDQGESTSPRRWWVSEPGVGHLAVLAGKLWPDADGLVTSRDALALRSTQRSVEANCAEPDVEYRARWGFVALPAPDHSTVDSIVARLPDQAQREALTEMLDTCEDAVTRDGVMVVFGGATEVSRVERLVKHRPNWHSGHRLKHRGMSGMAVFHRMP